MRLAQYSILLLVPVLFFACKNRQVNSSRIGLSDPQVTRVPLIMPSDQEKLHGIVFDTTLVDSQSWKENWRVFSFPPLGFKFKFHYPFDKPVNYYITSPEILDTSMWTTFRSQDHHISFKYPPVLRIQLDDPEREKDNSAKFSCFDSIFTLEYTDSTQGSPESVPLVKVYFTSSDFSQVARHHEFLWQPLDSDPDAIHTDTTWITSAAPPDFAIPIHGHHWQGLRGEFNYRGYVYSMGQSGEFSTEVVFLVRPISDSLNVVFSFSSYDYEFQPPIAEEQFYWIVSTFKYLK